MADLAILVTRLADAKAAEERAKAARVAIELEMAAAIGVPDSWTGSTTSTIGEYKVTCRRPESYKVDAAVLDDLRAQANDDERAALDSAIRWKPELDKKGYDALSADMCKWIAPALTRTPGKIAFSLKLNEQK